MIKNDQSIAIAGFGQEGKSALEYYKNLGFRDVQVFDESKGDDFLTIPDSSLIIRSPGIKIDKFKISSNLWSSTNEFFEKCPALIIGVTGSKARGQLQVLYIQFLFNSKIKII